MVGIMAAGWGDRAASLFSSARSAGEMVTKLERLRQLREVIVHRDPSLLPEFVPRVAELQTDTAAPVRKFLVEVIGEIGLKHIEILPEIVPALISILKDEVPAVTRQVIKTATTLFQNVLVKVAIQGLYSSEIDDPLKASWAWMLRLKSAVFPIAFQLGTDGTRLRAVKFVEAVILLYTPDPNGSSDPPPEAINGMEFNMSWLRGGHPVLNVGDLATEASQSLGLLLDQLRLPHIQAVSNSMVIVLINSLSTIAKKRPSFYGRILPVLLSLDPASSVVKGVQVPGAHHALKNAFMACLKCTHSSAAPWRARLVEALKAMNVGELAEKGVKTDKASGNMTTGTEEQLPPKEDTISQQACDMSNIDHGRKRHIAEECSASSHETVSGKRVKPTAPLLQEIAEEGRHIGSDLVSNNQALDGTMTSTRDGDSGAVQQLVAMFAALVAKGDIAAQSLEILITSISSDLLAEVVMANMRNLPATCPKEEGGDESVASIVSDSGPVMQNRLLAADFLPLSSALSLFTSMLKVQPSVSHDVDKPLQSYEEKTTTQVDATILPSTTNETAAMISTSFPSVAPRPVVSEHGTSSVLLYGNNEQKVEGEIPGLETSSSVHEIQETQDASQISEELQGTSQEHLLRSSSMLPLDISTSDYVATYSSGNVSPRTVITDASVVSSADSVVVSAQYHLPKMVVYNINLTDEQKDDLQKLAFRRILEACKQISASGSSHVHFTLLSHLANEFPLELDPWGLLQKHILSDYMNYEGHELTLSVLYRLYRAIEQDQDFLLSRTATSTYETFLLAVAENLRDAFPASDKSLGRLLGEVPYLSEGAFKLLECLCCPESKEKADKDFPSGDRVTQGLSAVWGLLLQRPSNRDQCLKIALKSAVHQTEEVRMKAIRLVANKLFPMASISKSIEDFATEKLRSVVHDTVLMDDDGTTVLSQKDSNLEASLGGQPSETLINNEDSGSTPSSSISEAQRFMSLYFALCTKKHSLLQEIFAIYQSIPKAAKQAVHRHIPILVRTIGSSPELLGIISDPPSGSESLLMQVLQILTEGAVPSQDLISAVKRSYNSKLMNAEILVPILSLIPKDEVLALIPQLIHLPMDKFQVALNRMLLGSPQSDSSLTPAAVLIAIHGIDPEKDGIPLKKVIDACSICFEQRQVFTQQVLAKVLNQLVEQIPLPLLFMRTVIQAIGIFPALVDFVMEILSRLVSKQIWKNPKLWVGFLKCAVQTKPQSFNVLLQLPATQLENALNRNPVLKAPLIEHASQPSLRSTLPRSTLVVLGLANDPQTSSQAQTSQSQAADTSSSAADAATEVTQESSALS